MFELDGVTKRFGPTVALNAIDLTLPAGQTTAILGPSGCGKSTLLRLLVGLAFPDSGTVRFDGEAITPKTLPDLRRRIGYVIQEGGLFPHMTARANVTLVARQRGWARDRLDARFTELMELTRLPPEAAQRFPTQLSGGQRQRVSLMRALFLDPDVVLFDEPMGALDPIIRRELQTQIRRLFEAQHRSAVLVTHDIAEAGFLADWFVLLDGGRIAQQGTLADLVHRPATEFVQAFIASQRSPLENVPA